MRTPCAFHQSQSLTQFCIAECCLLPLCPSCLQIHRKEHSNLALPMDLIPIDVIAKKVGHQLEIQHQKINQIQQQIMKHYWKNQNDHQKIKEEILVHREALIQCVYATYESLFIQLQNSAKRRDLWLQQLEKCFYELKQELHGLTQSLQHERYLRTIIMWNKLKPSQLTNSVLKKSERAWRTPSFVGFEPKELVNILSSNTKLRVLEIEGESGIQKVLRSLRVLRYGEQINQSSQLSLNSGSSGFRNSPNRMKRNTSTKLEVLTSIHSKN